MDWTLVFIFFCIFLGAVTQSTFGFGNALVLMPLLTLVLSLNLATPLVALMSTSLHISILIKHWRGVDLAAAWRLVVSSFIGIPLGAFLLKNGSWEVPMKLFLAFMIAGFALFSLLKMKPLELKNDRLSWVFGFISGVLGGAYNTNGPAVIIYGALRRWDPAKFRVTIQGYLFPVGIMVLISHYLSGLWTWEVWNTYLISFPALLAGTALGVVFNRKIPRGKFDKYVYILLIILGLILGGKTLLDFL